MACCGSDSGGDDKLVIDVEPDATTIDSPNASEFSKKLSNLFTPAWGLYAFAVFIVLIIIVMVCFSKPSTSNQLGPAHHGEELTRPDFIQHMKGKFGEANMPQNLVEGSADNALAMASASRVPLLVYLHDPNEATAVTFCREALFTPQVKRMIGDWVFWTGDKRSTESFDLENAYGITSFPFIGVIGWFDVQPNGSINRLDENLNPNGHITAETLMVEFQNVQIKFNGFLANPEMLRPQYQESKANVPSSTQYVQDRELKAQQDAEYLLALSDAQKNEREKQDLEDAQNKPSTEDDTKSDSSQTEHKAEIGVPQTGSSVQSDSNFDAKRKELEASIPEEPAQGQKDGVVFIRVRFSNSKEVDRSFRTDDTLKGLLAWVEFEEMKITSGPIGKFSLASRYPREVYSELQSEKMLKDIHLLGKIILFVEKDETDNTNVSE
eukprot:221783_1